MSCNSVDFLFPSVPKTLVYLYACSVGSLNVINCLNSKHIGTQKNGQESANIDHSPNRSEIGQTIPLVFGIRWYRSASLEMAQLKHTLFLLDFSHFDPFEALYRAMGCRIGEAS